MIRSCQAWMFQLGQWLLPDAENEGPMTSGGRTWEGATRMRVRGREV